MRYFRFHSSGFKTEVRGEDDPVVEAALWLGQMLGHRLVALDPIFQVFACDLADLFFWPQPFIDPADPFAVTSGFTGAAPARRTRTPSRPLFFQLSAARAKRSFKHMQTRVAMAGLAQRPKLDYRLFTVWDGGTTYDEISETYGRHDGSRRAAGRNSPG
ncbi:hypothetical protein [Leisingera methylohalidivorans]|uniref:hypothetical protein n=1 Tax=Leisingera methylohalidivorans TaxID=133924 RepID=UPI00146FB426|nr:hypothetical protein [Leisingera methylohalidivorans]